jgi:hypothetical protein
MNKTLDVLDSRPSIYQPDTTNFTYCSMSISSLIRDFGAPDYRDWLAFVDSPVARRNSDFARDIVPYLSDYSDGSPLREVQTRNPWVVAFVRPTLDFEKPLEVLGEQPNHATIVLAEFVKHVAATIITVTWQTHLKDYIERLTSVCTQLCAGTTWTSLT